MKHLNIQRSLKKAGIVFSSIALVCFLFCVAGMIYLFSTDFPMHGVMMPWPITAALFGTLLYTMIGGVLLVASLPRPPNGGNRKRSHVKNQPVALVS